MSSILRALRKLDEDSISRESQPGEQKVKMKYMVHQPTKTSRMVTRVLFVVVVLLLVVTAILIRRWDPLPMEKHSPPSGKVRHAQPEKKQSPRLTEERISQPGKNLQSKPTGEQPSPPVKERDLQPQEERPVIPESKPRQPLERMKTPSPQPPPMQKPGEKESIKETKKPGLNLEGILWSQEAARRLALINNRYLKEGDAIEGASIVEIGKKEVTLQLGDKKWTIKLKK